MKLVLGDWHFRYRRLVLVKWTPGRESICAMVRLIVDACAMVEIAVMVGKLIFGTKTFGHLFDHTLIILVIWIRSSVPAQNISGKFCT